MTLVRPHSWQSVTQLAPLARGGLQPLYPPWQEGRPAGWRPPWLEGGARPACLSWEVEDAAAGRHLAHTWGWAHLQRAVPATPWEPLGFFSNKLDMAQTRYLAKGAASLCFRYTPLPVHAGGEVLHPLHRPQSAHHCPHQGSGALDTAT